MKVLTILNHGTDNSSSNTDLVISKLADLLAGNEGRDWMLNEGAGSGKLFNRDHNVEGLRKITTLPSKAANWTSGVVAGTGVEENVTRAVKFINEQATAFGARSGGITVNLAGHSRGSITCYKIARALRDDAGTSKIPVNIFAIDPVPGNMGTLNQANYKNIALGGNLQNSFLMLAESEHRLAFRPYVDALYSMGLPNHKFDTIPGTHGGINELAGAEKDAAHIVMSRALEFLQEHNSQLKGWADMWVMNAPKKLQYYSRIMLKIKKYQRHATMWNPGNLFTAGLQIDRERTAVIYGQKTTWGDGSQAILAETDRGASNRTRGRHRGLKLNEALGRTEPLYGQTTHATRPNRFFANLEHQTLVRETYGNLFNAVLQLERGIDPGRLPAVQQELRDPWRQYANLMSEPEREYCAHWLAKRAGLDY